MDRIPASPPPIAPLPPTTHRPRWSVMIPIHNCAHFLTQTLTSVLVQAPGPEQMQIEVVDDASTDADVEGLVARLGQGRVGYYRQAQNVGSLRNFETCLNRSRGELVHLLHGDDRVLGGFYEKLGALLDRYPQAGAAFSNYYTIDAEGDRSAQLPETEGPESGLLADWLDKIATGQRLQYVSMVVRRAVYEELGGFYGVTYGEDWEMWVRIASRYPVAYCPERLGEYRLHQDSISNQKLYAGQSLRDIQIVIRAIENHLPADIREGISANSRLRWAHYGIVQAYAIWKASRSFRRVNAQAKSILSLTSAMSVCWQLSRLYLRIVLETLGLKRMT